MTKKTKENTIKKLKCFGVVNIADCEFISVLLRTIFAKNLQNNSHEIGIVSMIYLVGRRQVCCS